MSVNEPGDEVRTLCAPCEEAYTWGVQHGRFVATGEPLWLVAVAHKGLISHLGAYGSEQQADEGLLQHLREYHLYDGPDHPEAVWKWIEEHDETLSVEIVEQPGIHAASATTSASQPAAADVLSSFLRKDGFVLLTHNGSDPSAGLPFEAWAYQGPLDFDKATPLCFGVGADCLQALQALKLHLPPRQETSPTTGSDQ